MAEKTILIERLKNVMLEHDINALELAKEANVGQSFVYDILNGKSKNPTASRLAALADVLGVKVTFLTGESDLQNADSAMENMVTIPNIVIEYGQDNIANFTTICTTSNYFNKSWIENELKANVADLRIVKMHGDGMSPTLSDSDMVIIDMSRTSPADAGIFAIFDGIGVNIKRLEYLAVAQTTNIRIISDNAKYAPYEVPSNLIKVLGRVIWMSRAVI